MNHCEEHIRRIDLYLDNELSADELKILNHHLKECPPCQEVLTERQQFLEKIRSGRPLYTAAPQFRAKIEALLDEPATPNAPREANGGIRSWFSWFILMPIPALAACALAIAGITFLWRISLTEARANAFVDMAVQTHRQQLAGHLPLELKTGSTVQMSAWFSRRVPFQFRLPDYQQTTREEQKYELAGGRLVDFKGARAAYVGYRMKAQPISLIVTSASNVLASGGEKTTAKGLTFHTHRRGDLQVVTWSVHNLTYALVSNVNLPSRQSCIVCHPSAKDRDLIQDPKSKLGEAYRKTLMLLLRNQA